VPPLALPCGCPCCSYFLELLFILSMINGSKIIIHKRCMIIWNVEQFELPVLLFSLTNYFEICKNVNTIEKEEIQNHKANNDLILFKLVHIGIYPDLWFYDYT